MANIYISSTFLDLQEYRAQVERVVRRMGHLDVAMEYYVAEDQRPVAKSLADVAACDIYIGIYAWRYGWQPTEDNPEQYSITEMEFRQAERSRKPCLIFLLSDEARWLPKYIDDDKSKIKKLRSTASSKHTADYFTSPDELGRKVAEAVHKWEKVQGSFPNSTLVSFDIEAYYSALRKRYGIVALQGLTPPQDEVYLQIQLRSIFVEQSVRENPPPIELPKEVWQKISRDGEIHPEDLPPDVTISELRRAREAYYKKPSRLVLDVLTDPRYQHTIILGDPGSGKSTLARYVMLSLIESASDEKLRRAFEGYLPLLIELRGYAGLCAEGNCTTFLEFLEYLGKTEGWHLTQAALHNYLKNDGRAVVIFDGLDEIFEASKREQITRQIVGFYNDYPKVRGIVTSRVIGYRRKILTDAGFTHFTLQDLDDKQAATFVELWYGLAMIDQPEEAKERRQRILGSFKESPSIRQLAGNPMLLTIMAIIGKHQALPRERWKLYDHAVGVLIQHWDVNKHIKDTHINADFVGEDDKKELLRRLAFLMQSGESGLAGNYIHRDQLQAECEAYLKARYALAPDRAAMIARAMIEQFRERSFILSLYGANLYGFVHRAFLEYFCASSFVHMFEKTRELTIEQLKTDVYCRHWEDQSWHEVLRLICGMIDEKWASQIIHYLLHDEDKEGLVDSQMPDPIEMALVLQCLSDLKATRLKEPIVRAGIKKLFALLEIKMFTDTDFQEFAHEYIIPYALQLNLGLDRSMFVEYVTWVCNFDFGTWNQYAIPDSGRILGSIARGKKWAKRALLSTIEEDFNEIDLPDTPVPINEISVWAIAEGWSTDPDTPELLRDWAWDHEFHNIRYTALRALAEYFHNDPETLSSVHEAIVDDEDEFVRLECVYILSELYLDDYRTPQLLYESMMHDDDEYVRRDAASTLIEHFRDQAILLRALFELAKSDPAESVRQLMLDSIAQHFPNDLETEVVLHDCAKNDPSPSLRKRAKELADKLETGAKE